MRSYKKYGKQKYSLWKAIKNIKNNNLIIPSYVINKFILLLLDSLFNNFVNTKSNKKYIK